MKIGRFSPVLLGIGIILLVVGVILSFLGADFAGWSLAGIIGGILGILLYVVINYAEVKRFSVEYSTRQWANTIIFIVFLLGVFIVVQMIANNHNHRLDLTPGKELTLAPLTKKLLLEVPFPVRVRGFYREDERDELKNLLELYALASNKFKYELFNLDRNPGLAKKYGVSSYGSAVVEVNGKQKIVTYPTEEKIINAILNLSNPNPKSIYFLSGHGEPDLNKMEAEAVSYGILKQSLETENYQVKSLLFVGERPIPEDASVVIIAGPTAKFSLAELKQIDEYWKRGGRIIFAIDPGEGPEIKDYLKSYGIVLGDDIVIDTEDYLTEKNPLVPIIPFYFPHPITEKFTTSTIFPLVRSVSKTHADIKGVDLAILARSGEHSWAKSNISEALEGKYDYDPKLDQKGPIPVAIVGALSSSDSENKKDEEKMKDSKKGKIVVFGDSDFLTNRYFELLGNKDLFLNTIHWLTEEESLITVRKKKPSVGSESPVFLSQLQARMVFIGIVIIQPVIILTIGMMVAWRRRQRG